MMEPAGKKAATDSIYFYIERGQPGKSGKSCSTYHGRVDLAGWLAASATQSNPNVRTSPSGSKLN